MAQNLTNSSTNGTDDDYFGDDYFDDENWQYEASRTLHLIWPPFLLVVGTVGNLLSLLVMMRKAMRATSTCYYLGVLAIADTLVLYIGSLKWWIDALSDSKVDIRTWTDCRGYRFLYYFSSHFASWLLVVMTIERFISIYFPLLSHMHCTSDKAKIVVACLAVSILLINVHHLAISTVAQFHDIKICVGTSPANAAYLNNVWPWIDAVMYSFLPVILIFVFNFLIIHKMYARKREMQNSSLQKSSISNNANRTTRMLLVVSTSFLITTSPSVITSSVTTYLPDDVTDNLTFFSTVTLILMFINHSINFFLYCATGQKFRRELCLLIGCKRNSVHPMSHNGDTTMAAGNA